jgi:hypothetical protein
MFEPVIYLPPFLVGKQAPKVKILLSMDDQCVRAEKLAFKTDALNGTPRKRMLAAGSVDDGENGIGGD